MADKKEDSIWTTSESNQRLTGQLVNSQGDIVPGQTYGSLGRGDWSDSTAYRAQAISQAEQRAYDLSLWKYQQKYLQDYYSPAEQMKRYGEAGLNPHLIYQSLQSSPTATLQSSSPLKTQSNSGRALERQIDATNSLVAAISGAYSMYYDTKIKAAELNQMKASTAYTQEQAAKTAIDNAYSRWLLGESPADYGSSIRGQRDLLTNEGKQTNLERTRGDIKIQEAKLPKYSLDIELEQKALERMDQEIENLKTKNSVDQKRIKLYDEEIFGKQGENDLYRDKHDLDPKRRKQRRKRIFNRSGKAVTGIFGRFISK